MLLGIHSSVYVGIPLDLRVQDWPFKISMSMTFTVTNLGMQSYYFLISTARGTNHPGLLKIFQV